MELELVKKNDWIKKSIVVYYIDLSIKKSIVVVVVKKSIGVVRNTTRAIHKIAAKQSPRAR